MLKKTVKRVLNSMRLQVRRVDAGWWIGRLPPSGQVPWFHSRFGWRDVAGTLLEIRRRWPDREVVLLSDLVPDSGAPSLPRLHCGVDPVGRLQAFAPKQTVFLYACDSDAIGLPYVRQIAESGGTFFPVQICTPAQYSNIDAVARRTLEAEYARQTEAAFQKFDFGAGDSLNLIQAIAATASLAGGYIEIGCFRGSSACVALAYMRERGMRRDCFFLDVFEGFVYQAARESADAMWADTHATEGIDAVRKRICASAAPEAGLNAIVLKRNIIEDALPDGLANIVVANIDVDLYEAVLAGLMKVAPRMVIGGIIVVEDPGHTPALIGSRLALDEFLASAAAAPFVSVYLESGQTFLIKTAASSISEHMALRI